MVGRSARCARLAVSTTASPIAFAIGGVDRHRQGKAPRVDPRYPSAGWSGVASGTGSGIAHASCSKASCMV